MLLQLNQAVSSHITYWSVLSLLVHPTSLSDCAGRRTTPLTIHFSIHLMLSLSSTEHNFTVKLSITTNWIAIRFVNMMSRIVVATVVVLVGVCSAFLVSQKATQSPWRKNPLRSSTFLEPTLPETQQLSHIIPLDSEFLDDVKTLLGNAELELMRSEAAAASYPVVQLTDTDYVEKLSENDGLQLILFTSSWCGANMASSFKECATSSNANTASFFEVDCDYSPECSCDFDVRSIPTIICLKAGKVVSEIVGRVPSHVIQNQVSKFSN